MAFEDLFEIKTLIKFVVLGVGLIVLIFLSVDVWKWRIMLTLSGLVGLGLALSGATIGKPHGAGGF